MSDTPSRRPAVFLRNPFQSKWRVTTQTGNLFGAGTDATVSVQIWGPKGMLGGSEIPLDNSKDNFERGEVDVFMLDIDKERDCGYPLEKASVDPPSVPPLHSHDYSRMIRKRATILSHARAHFITPPSLPSAAGGGASGQHHFGV